MTLVMGVDEAGYGPNLGPLAIGLSCWEVGEEARGQGLEARDADTDLYQLLQSVVTSKPGGERLAVADSKVLYKPGGGLAALERGVLSSLAVCGDAAAECFDSLLDSLGADMECSRQQLPWHGNGFNPAVPVDCSEQQLASARTLLQDVSSARLRSLQGRLVFPAEFNAGCDAHASKGLALSHWTLSLLRDCIDDCLHSLAPSPQPPVPIHVTCDKHGGRNNYAGLLAEHFPEYSLRVVVESRPRSAYLLASDTAEIRIEFRTKGESRLEAALASMVAKYLRELSMQAFNAYWRSHLPDLRPTAGYPVDAKRFKADIEAKQRELGIDDAILWRCR